ncbi:phage tail tape measure protein [Vibrio parahaemolyticus]|uniref:phage tail tape measure protein n=1 Tax=Vibrio parahaemolyticus TaxID=670 RepID=UPI00111F59CD|nr:phage tail tape measure protein [Vibrio parahaemolyticus]TOK10854.1 phage tail tape measure protein [Vibrio parahaemolyticus]
MANNKQKYSIVLDGVNQLGQPLSQAGKAINQLETSTSQANNELKAFGKAQKQIAQYNGLKQSLKSTESDLAAAKVTMAGLRQEIGRTGVARKEDIAKLKSTQKEIDQLTRSLSKQQQQLSGVGRELKAVGINTKSLGSEQLKLELKTKQANRALAAQKNDLKELKSIENRQAARKAQRGQLFGEAVGVTATVAPMVMAAGKAMDYESAYIDVQKVTSFQSQAEEDRFKKQMKLLAVQKGMDQVGMTEIVAAAGRSNANMTPEQLLQFADEAAQMSIAFDVDAKEAGATLATFKASMGLEGDKALSLAKTSNYLADSLANTEAKNIAAVMKRQGATALNAGFNESEVAALAGSIFAADGSEETSATALKNITTTLTAGYSATTAQQEAYTMLGLDADDVASGMQSDASGTLIEVLQALKDADDVDRSAIISELFGKEIQGSVIKLVKTMDGDQGLIKTLEKASDTAQKEAKWQDELNRKKGASQFLLDQIGSVFDRVVVALGTSFLPVLEAVTPAIVTVGNGLAEFLETFPQVGMVLGTVVTGILALKTASIGWKLGKNLLGSGKDLLGQRRLSQATLQTKASADGASNALGRLNRRLNQLGQRGGYGGYEGGGRPNRRNQKPRPTKPNRTTYRGSGSRSRFGRLLGLAGSVLPMVPSFAGASGGPTPLETVSNVGVSALAGAGTLHGLSQMTGMLPKVGKFFGKAMAPLGMALNAVDLVGAVSSGDTQQMAGSAGSIAGGAIGATLGSVIPVFGTALGGYLGSELGGFVGGKIGDWFSKNKTEESPGEEEQRLIQQVTHQQTQAIDQRKVEINMNLSPTGRPDYDKTFAQEVAQKTAAAFMNLEPSNLNIAIDNSLGGG